MKTGAEVRVMLAQDKENQEPPEAAEARKGTVPETLEGAGTWIADSWTPELCAK